MKYLVLHPFVSFGVYYHRGDVVDAEKIRSPRLKQSAGKIALIKEEQQPVTVEPKAPEKSALEAASESKPEVKVTVSSSNDTVQPAKPVIGLQAGQPLKKLL